MALVTAEVKQGEDLGRRGYRYRDALIASTCARPEPAKCRLKPLADGEQIVRSATIPH
ncbi:MAG: hypothetical protein WDN24_07090 [Sphingomonas sp.]